MQFIKSKYYEDKGVSEVLLKDKGYCRYGYAYLHPQDKEDGFASEITGGRIAEARAEINLLKDERLRKIEACEECRKFVKAVSQYKIFDRTSPTAKAMYRQLNRRIREVNKITNEINSKEFSLKVMIKRQDEIHRKLKKD